MQAAVKGTARAPRVLIVEDEPQICELISEIIHDNGLEPECVNSDQEAYEVLRSGAGYEALIVDVNLGTGTTGFDVARFARQIEPTLAVLYVSGQASQRSFAAFGVPNSEYVTKPFTQAELTQRLLSAMRKDG